MSEDGRANCGRAAALSLPGLGASRRGPGRMLFWLGAALVADQLSAAVPRPVDARRAQPAAARPRREPLRAILQPDAGERQLHRHPLRPCAALQETGRHLLAPGRRDRHRRPRRPLAHLDLPPAVAARRPDRRALVFLGGARLRAARGLVARRRIDGDLGPAHRRIDHRHHRRGPVHLPDGRGRRAAARLPRRARSTGAGAGLANHPAWLGRLRRRHPHQGTGRAWRSAPSRSSRSLPGNVASGAG